MDIFNQKVKKTKITPLIILAVAVHLLLLFSVLDIYFTSPLERGLKHYKPNMKNPPARRLVLFLADGLRVSALYNDEMSTATPYLFSIKENEGTWGVGYTQVPTESRPGHIAILAGFYEDPSAIFKGWQSNPVDFDTVINQSSRSICFGSPDIVHMFNKYNYSHITSFSYDPNMEDFSGKWKSAILDEWVFENAQNYLTVKNISDSEEGFIVFLHLLGIDTAGHSSKPHSMEYKLNIKEVDKEIEKFVKYISSYYKDNATVFVFTSDHGMTDWGSHGAGSKDETEVPFIAWGSGVAKTGMQRDLNLTDMAPLISSLLGINLPSNSLGVIPLEYLNISLEDTANVIYANALQLGELFKAKEKKVKNNPIVIFKPFQKLSENTYAIWKSDVENLFKGKEYEEIITSATNIVEQLVHGIKYFDNYFQVYLSLLATLAFIGWLLYLVSWLPIFSTVYVNVVDSGDWILHSAKEKPISHLFIFVNCICLIFCQVLGFSFYYTLYVLFPVTSWYLVYRRSSYLKVFYDWLMQFKIKELIWFFITYGCGIEMLIWTFYYRQALIAVICANLWNIYRINASKIPQVKLWSIIGIAICCMLFFPVMNTGYSFWSLLISFLMCSTCLVYFVIFCINNRTGLDINFLKRFSTVSQIIILLGAFLNTFIVKVSIYEGYGLHPINQFVSWATLIAAIFLPLFSSNMVGYRLISIILGLVPVYILLSGGIEPIFIAMFSLFTLLWVLVEQNVSNRQLNIWNVSFEDNTMLNVTEYKEDMRRAFIFFSFILLAFFGTGNLSSINSFDPTWTQTFITVFKPHTMAALIALKITIPFLILLCCFKAIVKTTNMEIRHVFTLLLFFCDLMVLQFFFTVKNHGSWLEIGMSLSRFIIALVTTLTVLLFYFVSKLLTTITFDKTANLVKRNRNI